MNTTASEKVILRNLLESENGLLDFTLFRRSRLTPSAFYEVVSAFVAKGLVQKQESHLTLTGEGIMFAQETAYKPTTGTSNSKPRGIPLEFVGPRIGINEFYLPRVANMAALLGNDVEEE